MENCLVTRYLASVENENLPFFNAIIVKILAGKSNILRIVPSATIKRMSGDGFIDTNKIEGTFTTSATLSGGTNGTSYLVSGLGVLTKFGFNLACNYLCKYFSDYNGVYRSLQQSNYSFVCIYRLCRNWNCLYFQKWRVYKYLT